MSNTPLMITGLTTTAARVPLARPISTAAFVIPTAPLVLIDVETDQGITGRAYIFGYSDVTLRPLTALFDALADGLMSQQVAPLALARLFENRFRLLGRQGFVGMAQSGLDMAFWDALGQSHGVPVAELLGGTCAPVTAYDSYGVVDPDRDALDLEQSVAGGFKAIKIKIGGDRLQDDLDTVRAVRAIIGPEIRLMVDYNQSLNVPEARRRIARLAEFDLTWVEEPVPAEDLAGHAAVRNKSPVPVQTGENWWFADGAANAIQAGASDLAMLDIMKIGGITGWQHAAAQAAAAALPVSSHIFIEASAHALALTPNRHYLEYLDLASAVLADPYRPENGRLAPRGPGLGMAWDKKAVARYAL